MKYWITTDTHFGHTKLVDAWKVRPHEFEKKIWKGLRQCVKKDDVLIHLGDVEMGKKRGDIDFSDIGASRVLITGNHDNRTENYYYDMGFNLVVSGITLRKYGKRWFFSHKPSSRLSHYDYNIHGHTHGNAHRDYEHVDFYSDKHIELALEGSNYLPWSFSSFKDLPKKDYE